MKNDISRNRSCPPNRVRGRVTNSYFNNELNHLKANLNIAIERNNHKIIQECLTGISKYLISNQYRINESLTTDASPLLLVAAAHGEENIVELLLRKKANVNKSNNTKSTALMAAAACGEENIVNLLVEYGADINRADNYGWTALMVAAENGNMEIVVLILVESIQDKLQTTSLPLSDDRCPISQDEYKDVSVPVQFRGKVYELSALFAWAFQNNMDVLREDRVFKFKCPHTGLDVTYSSLGELYQAIQLVNFNTPGH